MARQFVVVEWESNIPQGKSDQSPGPEVAEVHPEDQGDHLTQMTNVTNVASLVTMPMIVPDPPEVHEVVAAVGGGIATEGPEVEANLDLVPQDAEGVSLVADPEV